MTVIGPDRPGLVDVLAQVVAAHEGNWQESRMARLGGQFAGILRVAVPAERQSALESALRALESQGLQVQVFPDAPPPAEPGDTTQLLEIVGQDRPGIIHQIAHAIAGHGANIEELESECVSAAMSGETLFRARIRVRLPRGGDPTGLRRHLEWLAADLIVDVTFAES